MGPPPTEERLMAVYHIFKEHIPRVELMLDLPKTDLPASDEPIQALLNTLKVHPLGKREIDEYLHSQELGWGVMDDLIHQGIIKSIPIRGTEFFIRTYPKKNRS